AEERRQFDGEMTRESLHLRNRPRLVEDVEHLLKEMPARDIDAVRRDRTGGVTVAHLEGVLEDARDPRGESCAWMVGLQQTTSPEQMAETGLMERVGELSIRRPAVAPEPTAEVRAEYRGRISKAATATNAV